MTKKLYLVAYDVRTASRLKKAINILKDYSSVGQKSVFECWLSPSEKQQLEERLENQLDTSEDSIMLSALTKPHPIRTLGTAPIKETQALIYLG